MENIIMLILFVAPGLLVTTLRNRIYRRPESRADVYDRLFGLVMHSIVIFFINILIMKLITGKWLGIPDFNVESISDIVQCANSIWFLIPYAVLTVFISIIWFFFYERFFDKKILLKIENRLVKKEMGTYRPGISGVYEEIFHDREIMGKLVPVSIYQNGELTTSGCITGFNTPEFQRMEFELEHVQEIKEILEKDQEKEEENKILPYISKEYFVPEHGLLIQFYEPTRLERYWRELYRSEN